MKNLRVFTSALFSSLILFTLIVADADANLGGYTVEPIVPGTDPGTPIETVYTPFWSLPPEQMAVVLALSLSPALLFPIELLFSLKGFAYLGYRRIVKANVLDNDLRRLVYEYIRNDPGTSFVNISKDTSVRPGTLQYHLAILRMTGKITTLEQAGHQRYFENSGSFSDMEKKVLRFLRNEKERRIFELLIRNPEIPRKELKEALGISGTGVTWHMNRLSKYNILTVSKIGRHARYGLDPEAKRYIEKYLPINRDTESLFEKMPSLISATD